MVTIVVTTMVTTAVIHDFFFYSWTKNVSPSMVTMMVTAIHDQPCLVTIVVTKQTANTLASSKNIVVFFFLQRFSIMVENSKRSLLGGDRGSIAWENPQFRSTMVPNPGIKMNTETTVYEEEEDADETNEALEETVIDQRYDGFMKVIDTLKNQLIEEKQKNLKIETEVRTELCDEFTTMMADVEKQHEQRLQEEKDRASELSGELLLMTKL